MKLSILSETAEPASELGIFIKLPNEIARLYPKLDKDSSPPHITVLYVGDVKADKKHQVIKAIKEIASQYDPIDIWIDGLAYFTNPKKEEIAHSMVEAKGLAALSRDLWDEILRLGVKVENSFPDYTPHVTLQYGKKRDYDGPTPSGNFKCTELEIWVNDGKKIATAKLG